MTETEQYEAAVKALHRALRRLLKAGITPAILIDVMDDIASGWEWELANPDEA